MDCSFTFINDQDRHLTLPSLYALNNDQGRPTLPSLHALNLPMPKTNNGRAGAASTSPLSNYNFQEYTYTMPNINPTPPKLHVPSLSSSNSFSPNTHNSYTLPLTPAETSLSSTSISRKARGFRLVPCEPGKADVVLLIVQPDVGEKKTLLLFGPVTEPFRKPRSKPVLENTDIRFYNVAPSKNPDYPDTSILSITFLKVGGN